MRTETSLLSGGIEAGWLCHELHQPNDQEGWRDYLVGIAFHERETITLRQISRMNDGAQPPENLAPRLLTRLES